ncbi:CoA transferase [Burkholderia cenocepacia]|uniref:CaiB/BaiF CoA transferase family protein n=1 Tax=Burkholderia cenocepacia TaxID=95486 RepID=UPI000F57DA6A|nr:CoA transferase [Burkholderia cenocepacia]RQU32785.1 CoA transferase [Burkholderia cenocepacia]RQU56998.1 CoA transferase [Burkholderia cenocepacia]
MTATEPGPLAGLRVIEIGHYVAAPFCARLLADLGADVIKVEPLDGDPVRQWGIQANGHSAWFSQHGRNKRSIALDLKHQDAARLVRGLCASADAMVENFRPGQLARLGLGDDVLRAARPGLIIAHVSGFGQDGPYRDRAAFGVIGEAIGGLRYLTNNPPGINDLPPARVGISIGDSIAGLYAAYGIVAACWQRDRHDDGRGRTLDIALTEAMLGMMEGLIPDYGASGVVRQPVGSRIPTAAPSNAYPTRDGSWILIAANSDPLFARMARLIGKPALIEDERFKGNQHRVANTEALDLEIAAWTIEHNATDIEHLFVEADIPCSRVFTASDIAHDPQFRERGMILPVDDPLTGPTLHTGVVPRIPECGSGIRWPGPRIGQHTDEVLTGLLGLDDREVSRLREEGVIR